jgi:hypothetical protein
MDSEHYPSEGRQDQTDSGNWTQGVFAQTQRRDEALCTQSDQHLYADDVENLLHSVDGHGLVFRLFVPADDLLADAEPARKLSL